MTLTLRYMEVNDVPQVVAIDRLSFDPPWSARSYNYEITESNYSHMVVLEQGSGPEKPATGLRRLMQNLGRQAPAEKRIVAYGGLWHIVDEAHISTIASHPEMRGRGYGEVVLAGMVRKALALNAAYIVLEVRVSNTPAQNLYKKYGFQVVDVKPRYYHNNGEDAYDMRLQFDNDEIKSHVQNLYDDLKRRVEFKDAYTASP